MPLVKSIEPCEMHPFVRNFFEASENIKRAKLPVMSSAVGNEKKNAIEPAAESIRNATLSHWDQKANCATPWVHSLFPSPHQR